MSIIKSMGSYIICRLYSIKNKKLRLKSGVKVLPGSIFGGHNVIEKNTTFYGSLGKDSYIGNNSFIYAEIGNFTSIGDRVNCLFASHPIRDFVSTSPIFYSTKKQNGHTYVKKQLYSEVILQDGKKVPVIIGNDVWIGSDTKIVGKIRIHDGAVIAAGSVVTHDVRSYSIVAGVPAKEIGMRFDNETISKLIKIKWWNKDDEWLKKNAYRFRNVRSFLKYFDE